VIAADPAAARKRREQALREARVERWDENAGTAAMAGRDLPPVSVLAADQNLTALATQLKNAGVPGTLDTLRAQAYLALLTGAPVASLLPSAGGPLDSGPDDRRPGGGVYPLGSGVDPVDGGVDRVGSDVDSVGNGVASIGSDAGLIGNRVGLVGNGVGFADRDVDFISSVVGLTRSNVDLPCGSAGLIRGSINLTVPLATWLGGSGEPGHAAGYGPLDAADSRDLASAIAAGPGGRWCLTFTGANGRPVAHGCARTGPPVGLGRTQPEARPRAGPETQIRSGPKAQDRASPKAQTRGRGPGTRPRDDTWTFTLTPPGSTACDHASETPGYRPSAGLRHLVETRQSTCSHPGCRRPAARCDVDHTVPYHLGGRTCLCNLAPLCRRHHRVKQARGWALEQVSPGVLTWSTPAGRRYTVTLA
jgi:hypothetical protein